MTDRLIPDLARARRRHRALVRTEVAHREQCHGVYTAACFAWVARELEAAALALDAASIAYDLATAEEARSRRLGTVAW